MTNREIVSSVRNHLETPLSDDTKLSQRWVLFVLEKIRAQLYYEDIMAKKPISEHNKQTICVPFIETDENFCDCEDNKSICKILRSACSPPKIIGHTIFDISSTSNTLQFEVIKPQELKYKKQSRIPANNKKIYAFFRTLSEGEFLYLANTDFVDKALVSALFEEPQKAKEFNCCENTLPSCSPLDDPFYLDDRLVPVLLERAVKFFATALRPGDILNNDLSDLDIPQMRKK